MAESLQFSIGADTKSFTDGIGGMITGLAGLAAAFVSVQAITEAFGQAIDMGGRLHDLSTRTGETAGNLAILERAFDNTSVGADKLGPAISKMQKSMIDMAEGSKEAVEAFAQLGLSWADLEGKSPSEQLALIGQRLAALEDPALRAETAMAIFGRAGADLIPVLVNFSDEVGLAKEQLGSLPGQLDDSAAAVDSLGDNLSAISNKLTELAYGFLSEVVPAVEAFTSKLAGVDAASIGAGLADTLVGAFNDPMKASASFGDTLLNAAKRMGNEMVYQINYWGQLLFNTFKIMGSDIIPILGNSMTGAFGLAVGFLGDSLASLLAPAADFLGLDFIQEMQAGSQDLMVQGAAKISDSAIEFARAMEQAKGQSTVLRQDFFGVEESSAKIASDWQSIQKSGKELIATMFTAESGAPTPIGGAVINTPEGQAALARIEAAEKVNQEPIAKVSTTIKAKTDAQIKADQQRQLGLIAGASTGELIGQSASAQKVLDQQKELETLIALGKGGTPEAASLQTSIDRNLDVAFGNTITSADREAIRGLALDEYYKGSEMSISKLEDQAELALLEQKRANDPLFAQEQRKKADEAAAGTAAAKEKPITMSSMVNTVIQILQKIEPKIPQYIMS